MIKGKAVDETHIACGEAVLRCTGDKLSPGATAPSRCASTSSGCGARPQSMDNVLPGTVMRQVFLGSSRDYMVETADGTQLRVVTSPAENVAQGAPVWLYLPPERCRVLSG